MKNRYLRLISGDQTLTVSACNGGPKANIYHAKKTFPGYIDSNFVKYGCNTVQPSTKEIDVLVYEMYNKNADFKTLFGSLSSDLKSLAFESQEQIIIFVQEHKSWLHPEDQDTFFLFTEIVGNEEKIFVASVDFYSDGLGVYVNHVSRDSVCNASRASRVVVPATKTLETQS